MSLWLPTLICHLGDEQQAYWWPQFRDMVSPLRREQHRHQRRFLVIDLTFIINLNCCSLQQVLPDDTLSFLTSGNFLSPSGLIQYYNHYTRTAQNTSADSGLRTPALCKMWDCWCEISVTVLIQYNPAHARGWGWMCPPFSRQVFMMTLLSAHSSLAPHTLLDRHFPFALWSL
jgi:hypothetical protein